MKQVDKLHKLLIERVQKIKDEELLQALVTIIDYRLPNIAKQLENDNVNVVKKKKEFTRRSGLVMPNSEIKNK